MRIGKKFEDRVNVETRRKIVHREEVRGQEEV